MTMKYRNFKDPLYFDPEANDKIFVPVNHEVCHHIIHLEPTCMYIGRSNRRTKGASGNIHTC